MGLFRVPRRRDDRLRKPAFPSSPQRHLSLTRRPQISSHGGLRAIVISHPHFYTTHLDWSHAFSCPVYTHAADAAWFNRADDSTSPSRVLLTDQTSEILPGVTAINIGGHFAGQLALHWAGHLFHADGFVNVPGSFTPRESRARIASTATSTTNTTSSSIGLTTFSFMWSVPNMVPLNPDEIWGIWCALRGFEFEVTHGLFVGWDVRSEDVKARLLESMKIQVRRMGWERHAVLEATV